MIGKELYKRVGEYSIRGIVKEVHNDEMIVIWQLPSKKTEAIEKISDIGKQFFETESELIRLEGAMLRHLAPAVKKEVEEAKCFYGYPLKVGDYVVAMDGRPLYNKAEGTIESLYTLSNKEGVFADVFKNGLCVCQEVLANLFTVSERFVNH